MTKMYRSARGKNIDIDRVKLTNESTLSVGNMRVNARGDVVGAGNKIAATRNQVMDQVYAVPEAGYSPNTNAALQQQQALMEASNAKQLAELANNLTVPVQPTQQQEPVTPAPRGSLASSVAKPTTVTQEALPKPKDQAKANGPSRI
jgi:hypothetical protein